VSRTHGEFDCYLLLFGFIPLSAIEVVRSWYPLRSVAPIDMVSIATVIAFERKKEDKRVKEESAQV
jgi:hypothetical protein